LLSFGIPVTIGLGQRRDAVAQKGDRGVEGRKGCRA
jgi:hypothetical protein